MKKEWILLESFLNRFMIRGPDGQLYVIKMAKTDLVRHVHIDELGGWSNGPARHIARISMVYRLIRVRDDFDLELRPMSVPMSPKLCQ